MSSELLIIPDVHSPYEDKKAWANCLKIAREVKPKHIAIMGDFADCYQASFFDKSPDRKLTLKDEFDHTNKLLDQLHDAAPKAKTLYCMGNHERRIERLLQTKAPELWGMFSYEAYCKLVKRGFTVVPYMRTGKVGKLHLTHDTGQSGPTAYLRARTMYEGNIVIGHIHSMGIHYTGNCRGEHRVCASFGWLGDFDAVDYQHHVRALTNWQHGVGLGKMDSRGNVVLQPVPFIEGSYRL